MPAPNPTARSSADTVVTIDYSDYKLEIRSGK